MAQERAEREAAARGETAGGEAGGSGQPGGTPPLNGPTLSEEFGEPSVAAQLAPTALPPRLAMWSGCCTHLEALIQAASTAIPAPALAPQAGGQIGM